MNAVMIEKKKLQVIFKLEILKYVYRIALFKMVSQKMRMIKMFGNKNIKNINTNEEISMLNEVTRLNHREYA